MGVSDPKSPGRLGHGLKLSGKSVRLLGKTAV